MKIALINDTHFGARDDNRHIAEHINDFFDVQFFPYLAENNIKTIVHLGDVFERRKYINYKTLSNFEDHFLRPIQTSGITAHMIVGNHDVYYKNTNKINSLRQLIYNSSYASSVNVYWSGPVVVDFDGCSVGLVPWICPDNYDQSIDFLSSTDARVIFGHFEIGGFQMYRGYNAESGMSQDLFGRFDLVASGHFHHKSSYKNIHYLGAQYQMNWNDYDDQRGFHIFDTETGQLEYVVNKKNIFHKIVYDDRSKNFSVDKLIETVEDYQSTYVKVVIKAKTKPATFDLFNKELSRRNCADIKFVEDHMHSNDFDESDLVGKTENTRDILIRYSNSVEYGSEDKKQAVSRMLDQLFIEANSI